MLYGLYLSAAGLQAQEAKQAVISNNMANAETAGFKRDLAVMRSRLNEVHENGLMAAYRTPILEDEGGGVTIGSSVDLSQGELKQTGNATDVALVGKGFFTVQGKDAGQKLLTRDGRFLVNNDGNLVTLDGRAVLGTDGNPVQIKGTGPITIDGTGTISQGGAVVAKLGLADVNDPRQLVKIGDNLLAADDPQALRDVPAKTVVRQGRIESSGVDPMAEMVNMMEGQRAFDANAKMISYQDTMLQEVNTIGKVA
ncbi:MAG TPA: flagellar hook-basal body protein [Phycisphaerae bacterium]|nr:flagellar hook-basal body protein [Phycisphaerae bacterium]